MYGEQIKQARLKKGWTQEDLARRSGIAQPLISAFENEKTRPSLDQATMIGGALGDPCITQAFYYFSPYCQSAIQTNYPEIDNTKFPQLEDLVKQLSTKIKEIEYHTKLVKNYSGGSSALNKDKIYINEFNILVRIIRDFKNSAVLLDDIADIFRFV